MLVLNEQQQAAAQYGLELATQSPPLLIIAGAGTGKTQTLAHKAALLLQNGADPARILLLTFARRAAAELSARANAIAAAEFNRLKRRYRPARLDWSGTFHAVSARLLRHYAPQLGIEADFSVIDRADAADQIDLLRHQLGYSALPKRFPKKQTCLDIYSRCVNAQLPVSQIVEQAFPHCADWVPQLQKLFAEYATSKQTQASLDYDDLLLYCFYMANQPVIAKQVRQQFDYVLVDEYQDTNILQSGILMGFFPDGRGLTVVGDDAQSIYRFRSADVSNILNFPQQFKPAAKIITLQQNYRSKQAILDLANQLLAEADEGYKVNLNSSLGQGAKPSLVTVEDDAGQANFVVESVLAARENGVNLKQQAVLFRSGYHSDRLELELTRRQIPYIKYGGLKFLEAAHVKDVLALLRWADNPKQQLAAFRLLKLLPGIGPKLAHSLYEQLQVHQYSFAKLADARVPESAQPYFSDIIVTLSEVYHNKLPWPEQLNRLATLYQPLLALKYDDHFARWGDIEQLQQISQQYADRSQFLTELTLDPPQLTGDLAGPPKLDDDFLILSTIHSAKGQEWRHVHILNVADGNFPNEFAIGNKAAEAEERRLLYVAMTRAKESLNLIQPLKYWVPQQQSWGDKHVYGAKSRFLTDSVVNCLQSRCYPPKVASATQVAAGQKAIADIKSQVLAMWGSEA